MENIWLKNSHFKKIHTLKKTMNDAMEYIYLFNSPGYWWIGETEPHWGYETCMWILFFNSLGSESLASDLYKDNMTFQVKMMSNDARKLGS